MQILFKSFKIEVVNEIESFYKQDTDNSIVVNPVSNTNRSSLVENVNSLLKSILKKLWSMHTSIFKEF